MKRKHSHKVSAAPGCSVAAFFSVSRFTRRPLLFPVEISRDRKGSLADAFGFRFPVRVWRWATRRFSKSGGEIALGILRGRRDVFSLKGPRESENDIG